MIVDGIPSRPHGVWTPPMIKLVEDDGEYDHHAEWNCPAHLPPPTEQELDDYVQFGIEPVC